MEAVSAFLSAESPTSTNILDEGFSARSSGQVRIGDTDEDERLAPSSQVPQPCGANSFPRTALASTGLLLPPLALLLPPQACTCPARLAFSGAAA